MRLIGYFFSILRKNWLRFAACILGFSVALGAVFAISTFTDMSDRTMRRFFMVDSSSLLILSKGVSIVQVIPFNSRVPESIIPSLYEIGGVQYVLPLQFKEAGNSSTAMFRQEIIVGIDWYLLQTYFLREIPLDQGRWPISGQNEVIIGPQVGGGLINLNSNITIRNENFTIVGITKSDTILFDRFIYVEYNKISALYESEGYCNMLYVIGDPEIMANSVRLAQLKSQILSLNPQIQILDEMALQNATGSFFEILNLLQFTLGIFPLMISITFVFVLLLLNIKDQQRDFAIFHAIGMSPLIIGCFVFFQTLVITLIGFILSIFVGYFFFGYSYYQLASFIRNYTNPWEYATYMSQQIPSDLYLQIFLLSLSIGIILTIYPAIKVARANIIKQVRRDE